MSLAIDTQQTRYVTQKRLVPADEQQAAKSFSAVVIPFSAGELAQAAHRTKEAAKAWKAGRSLPSGWSLLNMAQDIPAVRNWMLGMLGVTDSRDTITLSQVQALIDAAAMKRGGND